MLASLKNPIAQNFSQILNVAENILQGQAFWLISFKQQRHLQDDWPDPILAPVFVVDVDDEVAEHEAPEEPPLKLMAMP